MAQWAARLKVLPLGVKPIMASGRTSHHVHALDALWVESRLEKEEYHIRMLAADCCWLMDSEKGAVKGRVGWWMP